MDKCYNIIWHQIKSLIIISNMEHNNIQNKVNQLTRKQQLLRSDVYAVPNQSIY